MAAIHANTSGLSLEQCPNTTAMSGRVRALVLTKTTLDEFHHSLAKTTSVTLQSLQLRNFLVINSTPIIHYGMARGVVLPANAATEVHGSASSSHDPPLMTLSSECANNSDITLPLIK